MTRIKRYAVQCLQDEAQALLDLVPLLTDDFDKAIESIFHCKGRLVVTGVGKSGHIGAKIAATLASTGTLSFFVNPLDAFHGDLGMIATNDIVLAISNSGQTDELLRIIPNLVERNILIIAMSSNPDSLLARYSRYHLNIMVKKEACPLNLSPTSSTTATLAMGDAIACALIKLRNFTSEDYARFHPGGALGRRLLTKVKDVMYVNDLPIIHPNMVLSEAIICISKGKLGLVIVTQNEKIVGIMTDGDIRRAMQKYKEDFFTVPVREVMTWTPKTVNMNTEIEQAEKIMDINKIHALIVIDDNNTLVGLVDEFNCRV
jgi:arabinose-5-phosphate isomerase